MAALIGLPCAIGTLAKLIYDKSLEVKRFRHDCKKLALFVQRIDGFMGEIEDENEAEAQQPGWRTAYMALHESLEDCSALMDECAKYGRIRSLINSDDMGHRFSNVTQRLILALGMLPVQKSKAAEMHMETIKGLQHDMKRAQYTALIAAEKQSADLKKLMDMARADSSKTHDMLRQLLELLEVNGQAPDLEEVTAEVADLREELMRARALKNRVEEIYLRQIILAIEYGYGNNEEPDASFVSGESGLPPSDLLCPITYHLFQHPVLVVESGQTYERASIEEWLVRGHRKDPLTGTELKTCLLVPNMLVSRLATDWLERNPGFAMAAEASTSKGNTTAPLAYVSSVEPLDGSAAEELPSPQLKPVIRARNSLTAASSGTMAERMRSLVLLDDQPEDGGEGSVVDEQSAYEAGLQQRGRVAAQRASAFATLGPAVLPILPVFVSPLMSSQGQPAAAQQLLDIPAAGDERAYDTRSRHASAGPLNRLPERSSSSVQSVDLSAFPKASAPPDPQAWLHNEQNDFTSAPPSRISMSSMQGGGASSGRPPQAPSSFAAAGWMAADEGDTHSLLDSNESFGVPWNARDVMNQRQSLQHDRVSARVGHVDGGGGSSGGGVWRGSDAYSGRASRSSGVEDSQQQMTRRWSCEALARGPSLVGVDTAAGHGRSEAQMHGCNDSGADDGSVGGSVPGLRHYDAPRSGAAGDTTPDARFYDAAGSRAAMDAVTVAHYHDASSSGRAASVDAAPGMRYQEARLQRVSQLSTGTAMTARDDTVSIAGNSEAGASSTRSSRSLKQGVKGLLKTTKYLFAFDKDKF